MDSHRNGCGGDQSREEMTAAVLRGSTSVFLVLSEGPILTSVTLSPFWCGCVIWWQGTKEDDSQCLPYGVQNERGLLGGGWGRKPPVPSGFKSRPPLSQIGWENGHRPI